MRIGYMNWTQEKILCHTDKKNIEGVTNMRIGYMNWVTITKFYVIH
jgi:hypothetical protein